MDDISNWETAAAIAAICIGLGGLLLFSLVAMIALWRRGDFSARGERIGPLPEPEVRELERRVDRLERARDAAQDLMNVRGGADALLGQQASQRVALGELVKAGVLREEASPADVGRLEATVRRLDETMTRLEAAIARLNRPR